MRSRSSEAEMQAIDKFEQFVKENPKLAKQAIDVLKGLVDRHQIEIPADDDLLGQVEVGTELIAQSQQTERQIKSVAIMVGHVVEDALLKAIVGGL